MIYNYLAKKPVHSAICTLVALFSLTGCRQPDDYKAGADDTVYNIIDQKWQDSFGSKVNYKISDTAPSPNDIKVEKAIPASGILTLPQAVAIATAHNRLYQSEKEALYIKALDLRLARHNFEPQFFGGAKGGYVKDGADEGIGMQSNLAFEQLLASGARISTNVTAAWIDILTGNMRSGLTSILSTAITLPLLRGSDSRIVMENLTQAERDTVYQIRLFNRFRKTLIVLTVSQYYRVLQQFDRVKNAENNYETLNDVYECAEKLAKAGRLPLFELNQARQDKLEARDIYIQEEKIYRQVLDEFKITLSLPTSAEFQLDENELKALSISGLSKPDFSKIQEAGRDWLKKNVTIEALDLLEKELELLELIQPDDIDYSRDDQLNHEIYVQLDKTHKQILDELKIASPLPAESVFSEEDVIKTALALRLDLANQSDAIYDAGRKVLVAADNLRAGLGLTASTDVSFGKRTDFVTLARAKNIAGLGLDLDLPLERMAESNEYRKASITLNQQQRAYNEAVDIVTLQVRQAYRNLNEAAQRHEVYLESLALANKRFKNTFLLLQYGRANTRDVLDAQEDLCDAQNAATESMVSHAVAMLEFYRDVGVLQIRQDGMWERITE